MKRITVTSVLKDMNVTTPAMGYVTIVGTYASATQSEPSQRVTIPNYPATNPAWSRQVQATEVEIIVKRNVAADSVSLTIGSMGMIASSLEPTLSHVPRFTTVPVDGACYTSGGSPDLEDFTAVAASELSPVMYGWKESADGLTYGILLATAGIYDVGTLALTTITSDTAIPTSGDTVTIGAITYTFRTTLTAPAVGYEVLIDGSAAAALDNLKLAINYGALSSGIGDGSQVGTKYSTGTVQHPLVTAETNGATTQVIQAIYAGTGANGIVTTEISSHLSWAGATMNSGTPGTPSAAGEGGIRITHPSAGTKYYRCVAANYAGAANSSGAALVATTAP